MFFYFPQEIVTKPTRFPKFTVFLDLGKLYGYDVISLSSEGKFGFKIIQTHLKKSCWRLTNLLKLFGQFHSYYVLSLNKMTLWWNFNSFWARFVQINGAGGLLKKAKNVSRPLDKVTSSDSKNLCINYKHFACFSYNLA